MSSILSSLYPPFPSDYLPAWLLSWFFSSNLLSLFLLFSPFSAFSPPLSAPSFPPYLFLWFVLLFMTPFIRKVSWCSWLSHHLDVVRVPGSNPGETILFFLTRLASLLDSFTLWVPYYLTYYLTYSFLTLCLLSFPLSPFPFPFDLVFFFSSLCL